ncbi:hypothetical protein B0H15DRAFT_955805 [Mycena belliarum]|uniref:Uncharacterized protein n=1 Tax=Mycena belliarum TaxID=1033014 RepID=A0AAD6TTQ3_9AGAR|nr:hypothetical protein B0H15DRAFT_955805 [Mycena belliae]
MHPKPTISPAGTRVRRKKRKATDEPESGRVAPEPPSSCAPSEPPRTTTPGAKAETEVPVCREKTAECPAPSEWDLSALDAAWQALIDEIKANEEHQVPWEQALTLGTEYYTLDENSVIEPGEPNTIVIEVGPGWEAKSRSFENSKYLLGKCVDKAERSWAERSTLLTKSMSPAIHPASGSGSFRDPMDFELTEEPDIDDRDEMDWWK